ncbi:hypothetical protein CEXT_398061 [Caerostris extrusa]|uniref:Uncharacterized protein n=1 Tax=Caerostris extrusa TaxID=172846 RepID=A0AAV4NG10_CAEEX|nr:hypothetical protein CEXT_398061 [Caerostris extrusa]
MQQLTWDSRNSMFHNSFPSASDPSASRVVTELHPGNLGGALRARDENPINKCVFASLSYRCAIDGGLKFYDSTESVEFPRLSWKLLLKCSDFSQSLDLDLGNYFRIALSTELQF